MPDCSEVHLPFFRKLDAYISFREHFAEVDSSGSPVAPPSYAYFLRVWRENYPHIKVRKVRRFTKCEECELLRSKLEKAGMSESKSAPILLKYKEHHKFIARERQEYCSNRLRAAHNPSLVCSMIIDGADQSAFGLPHFVIRTKAERGHSMKIKLIGLIDHGAINRSHLFLMTEEFETGSNHVVEALHRSLTVKSQTGSLPDTLFLQMDNCTRENKNRFTLSYVEFLVSMGVFLEATVAFLPIGHTHEDIDQLFSRTATHLRIRDAVTIEDLAKELRESYTPTPNVSIMRNIANFSGLLTKSGCVYNRTAPFSQFRYFRFTRAIQAANVHSPFRTHLAVKIDCSEEWKPFPGNSPGKGFLKSCPDLSETPDTKIVCPPNIQDVTKRIQSVESVLSNYSKIKSLLALRDQV